MTRHLVPALWPAALALGALLALLPSTAWTSGGPDVGAVAPTFEVKDADGAPVRLEDYRGRVVVLNFWASWCTPCLAELPLLDAMHGRVADRGATVLALNVDTQRGPAMGAVRKLKLSLPLAFDPKGAVVADYAPPGLPATYVIGPKGLIRAVRKGEIDEAGLAVLEAEVIALLGDAQ